MRLCKANAAETGCVSVFPTAKMLGGRSLDLRRGNMRTHSRGRLPQADVKQTSGGQYKFSRGSGDAARSIDEADGSEKGSEDEERERVEDPNFGELLTRLTSALQILSTNGDAPLKGARPRSARMRRPLCCLSRPVAASFLRREIYF